MAVGPLEPFLGTEVAVANPWPSKGRLTSCVAGRKLWDALFEIMRHGRLKEVRITIVYEEMELLQKSTPYANENAAVATNNNINKERSKIVPCCCLLIVENGRDFRSAPPPGLRSFNS